MTRLLAPRFVHPTRRVRPFSLFGDFDRLFERTWPDVASQALPTIAPRIDVHETDAAWLIDAELPGLDQKDIDVSIDEGVLTISAERSSEESREDEAKGYRHTERYHGRFRRSLRLPEGVEGDAVTASYKNGVLQLRVPKPEEVRPEVQNIPVTVE